MSMLPVSRDDLDLEEDSEVKLLTPEQIKHCMPKGVNVTVNQVLVDKINNIISNEDYAVEFRQNLMSHTTVLSGGKYKLTDYVNAVRFVTCKLLGDKNELAYAKTFPDRYDKLIKAGKSPKDISAHTSGYASNQLVVQITEQTMMPLHIVNADLRQQAINVLAETMLDARTSAKVKVEAADKLLSHLAPPKDNKIEITLGQKQGSIIHELTIATAQLAEQQRQMLQSGVQNLKDVAESKLAIEGEFKEID